MNKPKSTFSRKIRLAAERFIEKIQDGSLKKEEPTAPLTGGFSDEQFLANFIKFSKSEESKKLLR